MRISDTGYLRASKVLENTINSAQWVQFLRKKNRETYEHNVRVSLLSEQMADALRMLPAEKNRLLLGCFLHDIGKMLIPDNILNQRQPLSDEQWKIMKLHPQMGADILKLDSGVDQGTIEVVRYHHERWDGKGYPSGLAGDKIPLLARICSVIDAFDSMLSDRPYQKRMTMEDTKKELIQNSGTQFDACIVEVFLSLQESYIPFYRCYEMV